LELAETGIDAEISFGPIFGVESEDTISINWEYDEETGKLEPVLEVITAFGTSLKRDWLTSDKNVAKTKVTIKGVDSIARILEAIALGNISGWSVPGVTQVAQNLKQLLEPSKKEFIVQLQSNGLTQAAILRAAKVLGMNIEIERITELRNGLDVGINLGKIFAINIELGKISFWSGQNFVTRRGSIGSSGQIYITEAHDRNPISRAFIDDYIDALSSSILQTFASIISINASQVVCNGTAMAFLPVIGPNGLIVAEVLCNAPAGSKLVGAVLDTMFEPSSASSKNSLMGAYSITSQPTK